nr:hypothetical protein [Tanacetum cinerariifolium]
MGDANPIRTLRDYSKPSHEGFMNTIELPVGNNMVPLRSDTIRIHHHMGGSYYLFPCSILSIEKDCKTLQRYPDVSTTSWYFEVSSDVLLPCYLLYKDCFISRPPSAVNLALKMKRDMIIKNLDLKPMIDAMMRDFLYPSRWKELSKETSNKILPCGDGSCWKTSSEFTSFKKSLRSWFGSSDRSPWNEHLFYSNRMVSDRRGTTLFPTGSSMVFMKPSWLGLSGWKRIRRKAIEEVKIVVWTWLRCGGLFILITCGPAMANEPLYGESHGRLILFRWSFVSLSLTKREYTMIVITSQRIPSWGGSGGTLVVVYGGRIVILSLEYGVVYCLVRLPVWRAVVIDLHPKLLSQLNTTKVTHLKVVSFLLLLPTQLLFVWGCLIVSRVSPLSPVLNPLQCFKGLISRIIGAFSGVFSFLAWLRENDDFSDLVMLLS